MSEAQHTGWRKSRYSNHSADCVEVGAAPGRHIIRVRDSKQHGHGPVLELPASAWKALMAAIRSHDLLS